jgi:hypothetical protein
MEPQEHHGTDPEPSRPTGEDVLRNLEARLDRASQAAERLLAEATARAAAAGNVTPQSGDTPRDDADGASHPGDAPPAAGWQVPESDAPSSGHELELLLGLLTAARDLVPPELQRRLAEALRELLLAIRALIDWYLERVERRRAEPSEVEDIPIQ